LYNLYCEYNDNPNNTNPNDDIRKIDQNEYIIQVLSLLVNIDDQTDKILQSFPGGVAENITPGGVTNGVNPGGVTNNEISTEVTLTVDQMFDSVHGGVNFHRGVLQTYKDLNKMSAGHKIPIRIIEDKVAECTTCQIARLGMGYKLPDENLHLKPDNYRQRIGVDTLTITPVDKHGNSCVICIVEHFSKFTG
jgi:hypothetical protein